MQKPKLNKNFCTQNIGCFVQSEWKICFLFSAELSGLLFIGDAILQVSKTANYSVCIFLEKWNEIYAYEM